MMVCRRSSQANAAMVRLEVSSTNRLFLMKLQVEEGVQKEVKKEGQAVKHEYEWDSWDGWMQVRACVCGGGGQR